MSEKEVRRTEFLQYVDRIQNEQGFSVRAIEKRLLMYKNKIAKIRDGKSSATVADLKAIRDVANNIPLSNSYKERLLEALVEVRGLRKENAILKKSLAKMTKKFNAVIPRTKR